MQKKKLYTKLPIKKYVEKKSVTFFNAKNAI